MSASIKLKRRNTIRKRIRKIVNGTSDCPRLAVFRSNKEIYAQIIDDSTGKTIVSSTSLKKENTFKGNKTEQAKVIGKKISELAQKEGIHSVRFDRGGNLYHGRVKALADAAREGGLKF